MLRLLQTEFLKLRRKWYVLLMLLSALVMPILSIFYFSGLDRQGITPIDFYKWTAFSYTSWIILPIVLGVFSTMLMYDEHKNDTLKLLWIVPIKKVGYFFSKFVIIFICSFAFMMITALSSIAVGTLAGYIYFEWDSVVFLLVKCVEISTLTALAILPIMAVATITRGYIVPICVSVVYTFLGFILLMVNMYLHPLSSMTAIVMRNIPGVSVEQEINITAALVCIAVWSVVSVICANISLKRVE